MINKISYFPFKKIRSDSKLVSAAILVVVFKSFWCKVALKEELIGSNNFSSLFPQYLEILIINSNNIVILYREKQ